MPAAVIYARYSSDRQRAASIEQQVQECSAYAEREGFDVVHVYSDEAISGRTDQRDAFLQMVDDAKLGTFEAVIVYKLDRFARNRYDAAMYRHKLKGCGVRVISAMELIPDTPEGRLMEAMMEGVAEWYSADLSQKVTRGMRANAEKCLTNGQPVFGYTTAPDGTYMRDDPAAQEVVRIFELWSQGYTAQEICDLLAARGVLNQYGKPCQPGWLRRLVRDERYLGVYKWADVRIEGGMPQLVSTELWSRAQEHIRRSDETRKKHSYPLVGKLFDMDTEREMCGTCARGSSGREYTYYGVKIGKSVKHRVRCEVIEEAVLSAVTSIFADAASVDDVVAQVLEAVSRSQTSDEYERATERLRELKEEEKRIVGAISSGVALDGLLERAKELKEELALATRLCELVKPEPVDADVLREVLANLRSFAEPLEILEHMVDEVCLYRSEGIVVVHLPVMKKGTSERYQIRRPEVPLEHSRWWTGRPLVLTDGPKWQLDGTHIVIFCRLAA